MKKVTSNFCLQNVFYHKFQGVNVPIWILFRNRSLKLFGHIFRRFEGLELLLLLRLFQADPQSMNFPAGRRKVRLQL